MQIFNIPEEHPIHFTHAHWPTDTFDQQKIRDRWAFGKKGKGYIGLWCSQTLTLHSEVLTDRELRGQGLRAGWIALCAGAEETGDFNSFIQACISMKPEFDNENLILYIDGQKKLSYQQ
jgi:hypothetical protein